LDSLDREMIQLMKKYRSNMGSSLFAQELSSTGEDDVYVDMDIPTRPNLKKAPEDMVVHFAIDGSAGLRMSITSGSQVLHYAGRGMVSMPDGTLCSAPALAPLHPFLTDVNLVAGPNLKIFFKALLPKLLNACTVDCAASYDGRPAFLVRILSATGKLVKYELHWNAARSGCLEISGLPGYMLCGSTIFRGSPQAFRLMADLDNGMHIAMGNDATAVLRMLRAEPYLSPNAHTNLPRSPEGTRPGHSARPSRTPLLSRDYSGACVRHVDIYPDHRPGLSNRAAFLSTIRRMEQQPVVVAPCVPLTGYCPTVQTMNARQIAWFRYWKQCFFAGQQLRADLPYVFAAAYEILNGVFDRPEDGLDRLFRLWEGFRAQHRRLDRYMPRWCMDFILVHNLNISLDEIVRRISLSAEDLQPILEVFYNETMADGLHKLPLTALCKFSDYDITLSRFYTGNEALCEQGIRQALEAVEAFIKQIKGKTLLEYYNADPTRIVWSAFGGATLFGESARRIEMDYVPYSRIPRLRKLVTGIIRYAENLLRKQLHFAGRLRGFDLPPPLMAVIDRTLAASPGKTGSGGTDAAQTAPVKPVEIDLQRALELETESWENTRHLLEAQENWQEPELPQEPDISPDPDEPYGQTRSAVPDSTVSDELEIDSDADSGTEPEVDPDDFFSDLYSRMTPLQLALFQAIRAGDDLGELEARAAQEFTFLSSVADEINDLAMDLLGDAIIDTTDMTIYEEYREV